MITITGRNLENRYTTAEWAAITAVLPDRVWGHEVDSSGNPIGSKMGDGSHLWAALPYWYEGDSTDVEGKINVGDSKTKTVTYTGNKRPIVMQFLKGSGNTLTTVGASTLWVNNYSDSGMTVIVSVTIIANDDGSDGANEDTWYRIF